jgi:arylsulfatase A-like enzyme
MNLFNFIPCGMAPITLLIASLATSATAAEKPNILVIITDQQHAEMMSCTGNPYLQTPALDRLAHDGIRFTQAYVTNPVCVPSRISMATGVMAGRLGVLTNGMRAALPPEVSSHSLGLLIKSAGYDTFYGGKTHLAPELDPRKSAGYDEFFANDREALPGACVEFIEKDRDKPFFVVASFINPHDICYAYEAYQSNAKDPTKIRGKASALYEQASLLPVDQLPPLPSNFQIPTLEPSAIELSFEPTAVTRRDLMRNRYDEKEWRMYRWIYCRLTEQVDELIGRILAAVRRNGMEENTLVVFTSDHGDMDSCHRLASKGVFYENSVRVGFLMSLKGTIPAGAVDSRFVSTGLDLLPTLCDYAGIDKPTHAQGQSLRLIAEGKPVKEWREYVVSENHTGRMVRSDKFKYCVYRQGEPRESLVDLQNDPGELANLVNDETYRDDLLRHRQYLQQWIEQSADADARTFAILDGR